MNNLINDHLTCIDGKMENGIKKQSCLTSALREVRGWTNRDRKTGIPNEEGSCGFTGHWLGAMGYLTILDQIGKTYRPIVEESSEHPAYKNSIKNALKYFSKLESKDIKAIVALRNAFLHDFSLFNIDKKDENNNFSFAVLSNPTLQVVKHTLDENAWDGDITRIEPKNTTTVNLKTLGDLVEEIYLKLIELNNNDQLQIILEMKEYELEKRYFFYHF